MFHCPFSDKLNEEQKNAVQHILWEPKQSIPYILHGPPGRIKSILIIISYFFISFSYELGTGKTRTLVAAITEIVRTTNDFVLMLAHSNAACDEITIRLLDILSNDELFRLMQNLSIKSRWMQELNQFATCKTVNLIFHHSNICTSFEWWFQLYLQLDVWFEHVMRMTILILVTSHVCSLMKLLVSTSQLQLFQSLVCTFLSQFKKHIFKLIHNIDILQYPIKVYALRMV